MESSNFSLVVQLVVYEIILRRKTDYWSVTVYETAESCLDKKLDASLFPFLGINKFNALLKSDKFLKFDHENLLRWSEYLLTLTMGRADPTLAWNLPMISEYSLSPCWIGTTVRFSLSFISFQVSGSSKAESITRYVKVSNNNRPKLAYVAHKQHT